MLPTTTDGIADNSSCSSLCTSSSSSSSSLFPLVERSGNGEEVANHDGWNWKRFSRRSKQNGTVLTRLRVVGGRRKENTGDANGMEHVASIFVWSLKAKGERLRREQASSVFVCSEMVHERRTTCTYWEGEGNGFVCSRRTEEKEKMMKMSTTRTISHPSSCGPFKEKGECRRRE